MPVIFFVCGGVRYKLLSHKRGLSSLKAEINSCVLQLARSVDREYNMQGSMLQDAAIEAKLPCSLNLHHCGKCIFQGKNTAGWKSVINPLFQDTV